MVACDCGQIAVGKKAAKLAQSNDKPKKPAPASVAVQCVLAKYCLVQWRRLFAQTLDRAMCACQRMALV